MIDNIVLEMYISYNTRTSAHVQYGPVTVLQSEIEKGECVPEGRNIAKNREAEPGLEFNIAWQLLQQNKPGLRGQATLAIHWYKSHAKSR